MIHQLHDHEWLRRTAEVPAEILAKQLECSPRTVLVHRQGVGIIERGRQYNGVELFLVKKFYESQYPISLVAVGLSRSRHSIYSLAHRKNWQGTSYYGAQQNQKIAKGGRKLTVTQIEDFWAKWQAVIIESLPCWIKVGLLEDARRLVFSPASWSKGCDGCPYSTKCSHGDERFPCMHTFVGDWLDDS